MSEITKSNEDEDNKCPTISITIHENEKCQQVTSPLPMEVINKIFLFMKSPTVQIFKESVFYKHDLPFLLLSKRARVPCQYIATTKSFEMCMAEYVYDIYFKIASNVHPLCNERISLFYIYRNYDSSHKYSKDLGINVRKPYFDLLVRRRHHLHICEFRHRYYYSNWRNRNLNRHVIFSTMGVWSMILFCMFLGALLCIILS